jgi:transcriptional regulator with XRE-family HTH domain
MSDVTTETPIGFGPYVRELRERAGLKQKQIAERIGVSQSHYSAIEAKSHRGYIPAPEIVAGLSRVFRVSEMELLRAAGYLTDSPAAKRLDDAGDEYLADMDRLAQERGQAWMDRLDERIRTVIAEEVAPTPPKRTEQTTFGGI